MFNGQNTIFSQFGHCCYVPWVAMVTKLIRNYWFDKIEYMTWIVAHPYCISIYTIATGKIEGAGVDSSTPLPRGLCTLSVA